MNLAQHLQGTAERHGDAVCLIDEAGAELTYAGVLEAAREVAGGLRELGARPGDRIACALRNHIETVLLYWAAQWLGGCFVPLNWRLRSDEIRYCASDAQARVLAVEGASGALADTLDGLPLIAVADSDRGTPFAALRAGSSLGGPHARDEREPALMLYTSGTTGRPKGVPRSARAERAAAVAHVVQCGLPPGDRTLGVMPVYHTMGMRSLLAATVVGGAVCVQPDFRAPAALAAIERHRLTSLYLAPTLFHDLVLAQARGTAGDVSTVERLAYAGAPMTGVLVERCSEAFAPKLFVNHYGSTEIYTYSIHRDQAAKPGCAGRPGLNARLRLVRPTDDAGPDDVITPGEIGQIVCSLDSDEAFAGYWQRPDADARQIRAGWYFTGDLGQFDPDGDLWIVGRMDDMIISGGENVHPLEVEDWLVRHPAVLEAAVVGNPDERFGERVIACVVVRGPVTADELDAHCLASPTLAQFKRPREYRFRDELPKSASGKILRRLLRDDQGERT